jgi:Putative Actinobacterial Holin-X, holin superfamily III
MPEPVANEIEAPGESPGIAALLSQLSGDARAFARAEANYLKAQAGERAAYAVPALAMLGVGLTLAAGSLIALLVGLIMVLAPLIGAGLATATVVGGAILIALLLLWAGSSRLRGAFKKPEER